MKKKRFESDFEKFSSKKMSNKSYKKERDLSIKNKRKLKELTIY